MILGVDGRWLHEEEGTGIKTYAYEVTRYLNSECHLYVKSPLNNGIFSEKENMTVYKLQFPFYRYKMEQIWETTALPYLINKNHPDIFWGPRFFAPPGLKCPSVCTIHDVAFKIIRDTANAKQRQYFERLIKYAKKHATHFIAVSNTTKEDFCTHFNVNPEKMSVVYNGYNPSFKKRMDPSSIGHVKRKFKIDRDFILFIGTLEPRKNLNRLVNAYLRSEAFTHDIPLVLGGKPGLMNKSLFQLIQPHLDQHRIILTGYMAQDELRALYQSCLFFTFPSLYEGFGIPVLEAMASDAPVLTSNGSSLREIFKGAALLVDPFSVDSITEGLDKLMDKNLREKYRKKGRDLTNQFSWEQCSIEHQKIFEKLLL